MFEVKPWADVSFSGREDMRLRPKWREFKWKIKYNKLKVSKDNFKFIENYIWCGKANDKLHILNGCDTVKNDLESSGIFTKMPFSADEWLSDNCGGADNLVREYCMLGIKWGVWKAFAKQRYGNKVIPMHVSIKGALEDMARRLLEIKEFGGSKWIIDNL